MKGSRDFELLDFFSSYLVSGYELVFTCTDIFGHEGCGSFLKNKNKKTKHIFQVCNSYDELHLKEK